MEKTMVLWKKIWYYGKKTMVLYGKNYGTMENTMVLYLKLWYYSKL